MKPLKNRSIKLKLSREITLRILIILMIFVLVGLTIWLSGPVPDKETFVATPTQTPTAAPVMVSTPTSNIQLVLEKTPTTGVVVGTIAITLIILAGVFIYLRREK